MGFAEGGLILAADYTLSMPRIALALLLLWPMLSVLALAQSKPAQPKPAQPTVWSFEGRQVDRRSTSPTELLVEFTLKDGESPILAAVGCAQATRRAYTRATYVYCAAYTPAAYPVLSGKLRLCYSASVSWFGGESPYYNLGLAQEDPRYPPSCPALGAA